MLRSFVRGISRGSPNVYVTESAGESVLTFFNILVHLAAVALAALGATVAGFTARPRWKGAVRQLGLGAAAAGITYAVGSAFGVGLS